MAKNVVKSLFEVNPFEEWFAEVYEANFERLYRYAFSITKDKMIAEDTVSDVFFNIWNNRPDYQNIRELSAYLHISVKHQAIRLVSKDPGKFSYSNYDESLQISEAVDPESLLIGKELEVLLAYVFKKMSPHELLVYEFSKNKGYSNQQIADELGVSKRTVENQLYKATKHIKMALVDHFKDSGKTYDFLSGLGVIALVLNSALFEWYPL